MTTARPPAGRPRSGRSAPPSRARGAQATRGRASKASSRRTTGGGRRHPLGAFTIVISLFALALVLQLVRVQIFDGSRFASYATNEVEQKITLPASRGSIYDRTGDLLSVSVTRYDIIADDFLITASATEAGLLAPVLHLSVASLTKQLSEKNGYVVLARQVSTATETAIANLDLEGISFETDMLRVSPGGSLFQPLLGGVNAAGQGDAALEYEYNNVLTGTPGSEVAALDPNGAELPSGAHDVVAAKQGASLVLTIDEPLQNEVTKDVAAQMQSTHADSGVAVIEDVHTGDILAMVDLVRGAKSTIVPAESNLAFTSVYQPGSVMKLATISYSLQDRLISPNTEFTVPYSLNVGGYTFQDADLHATEQLPVSQILAQSSNIGTIEISRLLGMNRLAGALKAYGFGQVTGANWPGESPGIVSPPSQWVGSTAASVPIGTGEAVTPMQVLDAYNSIANGGVFVTPRLVSATVGANGTETQTTIVPGHRTLEASTVSEVVPLLTGVVCDEDGTAILARIPGYTVAGKTGTAQQPESNGLGYIPGDWNATFVGFVPAEAPKLSGIVVLNHPTPIYGGTVSAPVFAQVMQYALRHFDIAPPTAVTAASANSPAPITCSPGQ